MPKYAYRCSQCDARYDRVEGFDAPSRHDCPECGGLSKRQFSTPTIVFKGSGWYSTDNKRTLRTDGTESGAEEKPAVATNDNGHGHSHGPGGHSHDHGHSHPHTPAASTPGSTTTPEAPASSDS